MASGNRAGHGSTGLGSCPRDLTSCLDPACTPSQIGSVIALRSAGARRPDDPGTAEPPASSRASALTGDLPRSFGPYVLFDRIGRGGMAEIFLARRRTTEAGGARRVVVKQILPELSENARFAAALVREAKLAARLTHTNVVQVFDLGEENTNGRRLFIAMEYVEGLDVRELLIRCSRQRVPLPAEFACHIVLETLRALDYAHRREDDEGRPLGIVHRDVTPSNVLLSLEGEVKLCDFGIARAMDLAGAARDDASSDPRGHDIILGKAGYMSPEQAQGRALDARADLFSAGVMLWEMLAGRRMYQPRKEAGETVLDLACRGVIPPLPTRGLPAEDELNAWLTKALASDPGDRFGSAAEMRDALEAWVLRARLAASPIRFGEWLTEHFDDVRFRERRAREREAERAALQVETVRTPEPVTPPLVAVSSRPAPPVSSQRNLLVQHRRRTRWLSWVLAAVVVLALSLLVMFLRG